MACQVVTDKLLPDIEAGRTRIVFSYRKDMAAVAAGIEDRKTQSGYMKLSSPELTALDLVRYPRSGPNRRATPIGRRRLPDMHTLRDVCLRSATLDQDLRRIEEEEIGPLATRFADHLKRPGTLSEQPGLAVQAARIAVRLAELRSHRPLLASADSVLLQDGLDKAWSLDRRLGAMEQQVRAVTDSLKSLGDAQMRRVTQLVALIGFPFYLSTGLTKPIAVGALLWGERQGWWTAPMKDMQDPPTWPWWIRFSAVFGASVLGAVLLQRRDSGRQ